MAWTSPRTWGTETLTSALLNTHLRDNLKAIGDAWTSYTPTWGASGSAPSVGNGTLAGFYLKAGQLVIGRIELTIGSTTGVGSGVYTLTLPTPADHAQNMAVGSAFFFDTSGTSYYAGSAFRVSATDGIGLVFGTPGRWTATGPVAPATGDTISANFCYEAA